MAVKIQNEALAVGVQRNRMKGTEEGRRAVWDLVIGGRRDNIQFLYVGIIGSKNFLRAGRKHFGKLVVKMGNDLLWVTDGVSGRMMTFLSPL